MAHTNQNSFEEAVRVTFSRRLLAPFATIRIGDDGSVCPIINWHETGLFATEPRALAEAFSCACFNGHVPVVQYLLAAGANPSGGDNTGLDALHWAANRGQLEVVKLLIAHGAKLETLYGGTVLGATVWASANETRPTHPEIVSALLDAGANLNDADYPCGNRSVDEILARYWRAKDGPAATEL